MAQSVVVIVVVFLDPSTGCSKSDDRDDGEDGDDGENSALSWSTITTRRTTSESIGDGERVKLLSTTEHAVFFMLLTCWPINDPERVPVVTLAESTARDDQHDLLPVQMQMLHWLRVKK
ncbi:hypothetical protein FI667_g5259, partial [Globisporangium splendens]